MSTLSRNGTTKQRCPLPSFAPQRPMPSSQSVGLSPSLPPLRPALPILQFAATGRFTTDAGLILPDRIRLIAEMPSMLAGFFRAKNKQIIAQILGVIALGQAPKRSNLYDQETWRALYLLPLYDLTKDRRFTLMLTDTDGDAAAKILSWTHGHHIHKAPDDLPVIELGFGNHLQTYGPLFYPTLKVVAWIRATV